VGFIWEEVSSQVQVAFVEEAEMVVPASQEVLASVPE
jgi:hypothetical protein